MQSQTNPNDRLRSEENDEGMFPENNTKAAHFAI
jgi:hypothetical protein